MSGRRYRRRYAEVDAVQYDGTNDEAIRQFLGAWDAEVEPCQIGGPSRSVRPGLRIRTVRSVDTAGVGDWVVRTRQHFVIHRDEDFADLYVSVNWEPDTAEWSVLDAAHRWAEANYGTEPGTEGFAMFADLECAIERYVEQSFES